MPGAVDNLEVTLCDGFHSRNYYVIGDTFLWNQYVYTQNIRNDTYWELSNAYFEGAAETVLTIDPGKSDFPGVYYKDSNIKIVKDHKYLISLEAKSSKEYIETSNSVLFPYYFKENFTKLEGSDSVSPTSFNKDNGEYKYKKGAIIIKANNNQDNLDKILGLRIETSTTPTTQSYSFVLRNLMVFDLTRMFGSGNEPTIEAFNEMFPGFYPANSGEYKSIFPKIIETKKGSSIRKVNIPSDFQIGLDGNGNQFFNGGMKKINNVFDEIGLLSQKEQLDLRINLRDLRWEYYASGDQSVFIASLNDVLAPDSESVVGNITCEALSGATTYTPASLNDVRNHTSNNIIAVGTGSFFKNYIVLWDSHLMPLSQQGSDVISKNVYNNVLNYHSFEQSYATKRIESVDLGALTWGIADISQDLKRLRAFLPDVKNPTSDGVTSNTKCIKYPVVTYKSIISSSPINKTIAIKNGEIYLWDIKLNNISDFSVVSQALSGVILYYELSTEKKVVPSFKMQQLQMFKNDGPAVTIACYNDIQKTTETGRFLLNYYANPEGTHTKESGFITSYERKRYMGKTVTWNQLINKKSFPNDGAVINGLTVTNTGNGTFSVDGTASANTSFSCGIVSVKAGNKYLICGCSKDDTTGSDQNNNYYFGVGGATAKQERVKGLGSEDPFRGVIFEQETNGDLSFNCWVKNGYVADRLVFKPQVFDLTEMFETFEEKEKPDTPEKFWSYFPNKVYPYNAGETQPLFKISRKSQHITNLIPISTDIDGSIYNGIGYKLDTRLSTNGIPAAAAGYLTTGFMPFTVGKTIYVNDFCLILSEQSNCKVVFYNADHTIIAAISAFGLINRYGYSVGQPLTWTVPIVVYDTGSGTDKDISTAAYIRLSIGGYNDTADSIICNIT